MPTPPWSRPASDEEATPSGRLLGIRAVLAGAALGLIGLATLGVMLAQSSILEESGRAIDIAGRQRMLTQRAALVAERLAATSDPLSRADYRRQLEQMAEQLADSRARLLDDSSPEFRAFRTAAANRIAREPPTDLNRRTREYVAAILRLARAPEPGPSPEAVEGLTALAVEGQLLGASDALVKELRDQARRRVLRLRWVGVVFLGLSLAVVVISWRLLARPMRREFIRRLEDLRGSREMLRLTIEHSPLAIATCRVDGRIATVNPAWCALFEAASDELLGEPLAELAEGRDAAAVRRRLAEAARGDIARFALPSRWRRTAGGPIEAVLHCGVALSALHRPRRLIAVLEDRTAEVRALEEAASYRERASHLTRLATMGEMAAGIAHEINQPLSAVSTYAQACQRMIANDTASPEQLLDTLAKVSAQAQRAGEVIRHLRSFMRRRRAHSEPADLNRLIREAVELVEAGVAGSRASIAVELASDLPLVVVDRIQIEQVAVNLLRNAVEASSGVDDPVVVRTGLQRPGRVVVTVEDRGEGVAEPQRNQLFEPFFTTKPSGLGVGLSLSRSIVVSHGGSLWYEPRPGGGSRFLFVLPSALDRGAEAPGAGREPVAAVSGDT